MLLIVLSHLLLFYLFGHRRTAYWAFYFVAHLILIRIWLTNRLQIILTCQRDVWDLPELLLLLANNFLFDLRPWNDSELILLLSKSFLRKRVHRVAFVLVLSVLTCLWK